MRLLALLLSLASPSEAGQFRLRAREHFEWAALRTSSGADYRGDFTLASTIDAWFEEPMRHAYGFAVNSGGGRLHLGLEGKKFLLEGRGLFGRIGAFWTRFDSDGPRGVLYGGSWYAGLGWEIPVGRVGLAPELAFRQAFLEGGASILAFSPSLGIHFYVFPGDPEKVDAR